MWEGEYVGMYVGGYIDGNFMNLNRAFVTEPFHQDVMYQRLHHITAHSSTGYIHQLQLDQLAQDNLHARSPRKIDIPQSDTCR